MNDNVDLIIGLRNVQIEDNILDFPDEGQTNKIYVDVFNSIIYTWNGASYVPSGISGSNFLGTWDADTNTPMLVSGVGNAGDFYTVSVAGNTILDGEGNWQIDDTVTFNGTVWQKVPATNKSNVPIVLSTDFNITQLDTIYIVDTLTENIDLIIPDSILANGGEFVQIIKNSGDFDVTVRTVSSQNIGSLTLQTISQTSKGFTAVANGVSGSWTISQDSRDALTVRSVMSNDIVNENDNILILNGTFTLTLPVNLYVGFKVTLKNMGVGEVTLSSTVLIEDSMIKTINIQYDSFDLVWDGIQWYVV